MGTINKGILGGFSGTVGSVVGGTWKGIDYMRSKSSRRNFTPSQPQLEQQLKFAISIKFVQSMSGLVEVSFRNFAVRKTGINSALSYTLRNAVSGTYPTYSIEYADALVSRGDLPNALGPTVVAGAAGLVTWSWTNNSGIGVAKPTDKVLLAAYSPDLNQCIYTTGGAQRSAITDSLNLASFSGLPVHTWIGFISEDGRNVANSLYTGVITVA